MEFLKGVLERLHDASDYRGSIGLLQGFMRVLKRGFMQSLDTFMSRLADCREGATGCLVSWFFTYITSPCWPQMTWSQVLVHSSVLERDTE